MGGKVQSMALKNLQRKDVMHINLFTLKIEVGGCKEREARLQRMLLEDDSSGNEVT